MLLLLSRPFQPRDIVFCYSSKRDRQCQCKMKNNLLGFLSVFFSVTLGIYLLIKEIVLQLWILAGDSGLVVHQGFSDSLLIENKKKNLVCRRGAQRHFQFLTYFRLLYIYFLAVCLQANSISAEGECTGIIINPSGFLNIKNSFIYFFLQVVPDGRYYVTSAIASQIPGVKKSTNQLHSRCYLLSDPAWDAA